MMKVIQPEISITIVKIINRSNFMKEEEEEEEQEY